MKSELLKEVRLYTSNCCDSARGASLRVTRQSGLKGAEQERPERLGPRDRFTAHSGPRPSLEARFRATNVVTRSVRRTGR